MADKKPIQTILNDIYGETDGKHAFDRLSALMAHFADLGSDGEVAFSESDAVLITYGDTLQSDNEASLTTLHRFTGTHLKKIFSHIHILPFWPWSSDDGFSVIDFHRINPKLGTWADMRRLGRDFKLMFDLVVNHISAESKWFEFYLKRRPGFEDLAIEVDPAADLSSVVRPRALPLLTEVTKSDRKKQHVWTTFSADQIDLNFASLDVLVKMVAVLLFYVRQGAEIIRLDAIAYLCKKLGTPCIHLDQTHKIVKLFRAVLDRVAPKVMLLTETNVPHKENISYFGNGRDEAQMVYNFTLPPLLFYTFLKGDTTILSRWAQKLTLASDKTTFFNFTASHDGIGVRPLEGIVDDAGLDMLVERVKQNGGQISYKQNSDGTKSPYELNITYVDAMGHGESTRDNYHAARFLATQAIALALPGVPAVYIHSLLGSRNWLEGVAQTGRARTINRAPLKRDTIESELADPTGFRAQIFHTYSHLLEIRRKQPAFHPKAAFRILNLERRLFCIKRICDSQALYAITNVTPQMVQVGLDREGIAGSYRDLLSKKHFVADRVVLEPYQTLWLTPA